MQCAQENEFLNESQLLYHRLFIQRLYKTLCLNMAKCCSKWSMCIECTELVLWLLNRFIERFLLHSGEAIILHNATNQTQPKNSLYCFCSFFVFFSCFIACFIIFYRTNDHFFVFSWMEGNQRMIHCKFITNYSLPGAGKSPHSVHLII